MTEKKKKKSLWSGALEKKAQFPKKREAQGPALGTHPVEKKGKKKKKGESFERSHQLGRNRAMPAKGRTPEKKSSPLPFKQTPKKDRRPRPRRISPAKNRKKAKSNGGKNAENFARG